MSFCGSRGYWESYTVPSTVIDFNPLCATAAPANNNGIVHIVMLEYLKLVMIDQKLCTAEVENNRARNLLYVDLRFNRT
jgi:hypothetical protein